MLNPETLTILDPACGSGHILVEAYDVLKGIYEELGYEARAIPRLILEKNLYGLDIDDRAAQLASFALMMKARADDRRIFVNPPKLNILSLQSTEKLNLAQLWQKLDLYKQSKIGATHSLFEEPQLDLTDAIDRHEYQLLAEILALFVNAKTFGALIQVPKKYAQTLADILAQLENLAINGDTFQTNAAKALMPFIQQAKILAMQFDVVVANPPYMGGKGMNPALKDFAKKQFPDSKSDLFAMFIERGFDGCKPSGFNAQVTMQSRMFLSSYETLRQKLLENRTINTMAHLGARAFAEISGEVVQTTAFVFHKQKLNGYKPAFFRLIDGNEEQKAAALRSNQNRFDVTVQDDFKKIPGSPIAYWVSDKVRDIFKLEKIDDKLISGGRCKTHNDETFVRFFWELNSIKIGEKWKIYEKGGSFRKWYGNRLNVVDWSEQAINEYASHGGLTKQEFWQRQGITWSDITSSANSFRLKICDSEYSSVSPCLFSEHNNEYLIFQLLGFLNSSLSSNLIKIINPTLHANPGDIAKLPASQLSNTELVKRAIFLAKNDWDNYEISWDFATNPLIATKQKTLAAAYLAWETQNRAAHAEMKRLEEENNRLFIEAYGLQDELTPDVPPEQITLNHADREKDCRDFISYAVGCMFGRYSLDKPGLILANQGETTEDFYKKLKTTEYTEYTENIHQENSVSSVYSVVNTALEYTDDAENHGETTEDFYKKLKTTEYTENTENINQENSVSSVYSVVKNAFPPDEDNVIPMLDGDWFTDDITEHFRKFLRATFGDEHYEDNLRFIETALGKDIRKYFLKDFYTDHVKRYKKRPIYWLFSSPKGSFNALIYMHRYRPDTVSVVLNDYLREFRTKLTAHKNHLEAVSISASASQAEKTKALKDIEKINKIITELEEYERDVLYPLATRQIEIDLDDGVKVNYPKFGAALKKIAGLDAKEED